MTNATLIIVKSIPISGKSSSPDVPICKLVRVNRTKSKYAKKTGVKKAYVNKDIPYLIIS